MLSFRKALLILLAACWSPLAAPSRGEEEPKKESRAFGPPPGTRCEYKVQVTFGPEAREWKAAVYRPGGNRDKTAVILLEETSEPRSWTQIPIDFVHLTAAGRPKAGLLGIPRARDIGSSLTGIYGALFTAFEAPSFAPGTRWKRAQSFPEFQGFMAIEGVMENSVERPDEPSGALRLRTRRARSVNPFTDLLPVSPEWRREVLVDESSGRPLSVHSFLEMKWKERAKSPDGPSPDLTYEIDIQETSHRALSAEEEAKLLTETGLLAEAVELAKDRIHGSQGGGIFSLLLGQKERKGDPFELLDAYQKAHPQGLLASAADPLRNYIKSRLESEERVRELREKEARLIGQSAPGFTLKDLQGNAVSLSDFQGKPVLLAFWGHG